MTTLESVAHILLCMRWPKSNATCSWKMLHRKLITLNSEGVASSLNSKQSVSHSAKESLKHPPQTTTVCKECQSEYEKSKAKTKDKDLLSYRDGPHSSAMKASSQHFAKYVIRCLRPLPHLSSEATKDPDVNPGQRLGTNVTHGSIWC